MSNLFLKASNERDSLVTFIKSVLKEKEHSVGKELWAIKVVQVNNDLEKPSPYSAHSVNWTSFSLAVYVDRYRNKS